MSTMIRRIAIVLGVTLLFGAGWWGYAVQNRMPISPASRYLIAADQIKAVESAAEGGDRDAIKRLALHYKIALNEDPRAQRYFDLLEKDSTKKGEPTKP